MELLNKYKVAALLIKYILFPKEIYMLKTRKQNKGKRLK